MAGIADVARLAGVCTATVSRVLNGRATVRPATRERVLAAAAQLEYRPHPGARGLRSRRLAMIGVIVADIANPFFGTILRGIESVVAPHGYPVMVCNTDESPERERFYVKAMLAERVAGVIFAPSSEDPAAVRPLLEAGIPTVCVDRAPAGEAVDCVLLDNALGMQMAVDHLLGQGYRRIGLVTGPLSTTTGRERLAGFQRALARAGLPEESDLVRETGGYRRTAELLDQQRPPEALIVANGMMTLGAMAAVHERELAIPGDLALLGFDDAPWLRFVAPPLTVVEQPVRAFGERAADLLLAAMQGGQGRAPRRVVLPPRLVVRMSTGPRLPGPPGAWPDAAPALGVPLRETEGEPTKGKHR